jgi:broad specificity phosphatase PhoE
MGQLVLIRHGESEGNRDRVFTRTPEVPLTEAGRTQVRDAGDWIARRYRPIQVVSSPFTRARQTAAILTERLRVPVVVEEDLRERSYGALAGQPYVAALECAEYDPAAYWRWCPPGGETLLEVAVRAGAVLDRVAAAAGEADLVVVSHGAVMRALWWHVTGVWRQGHVARNAGIVVVDHRSGRYRGAVAVEDG